jgi:hypothetical protein
MWPRVERSRRRSATRGAEARVMEPPRRGGGDVRRVCRVPRQWHVVRFLRPSGAVFKSGAADHGLRSLQPWQKPFAPPGRRSEWGSMRVGCSYVAERRMSMIGRWK